MKNRTFLLLGTNLGDRKKNLTIARDSIELSVGLIKNTSSIYETAAWGKSDQPDFLNQAVEVETELSPMRVLKKILDVETIMGRVRNVKWSERLIDIDILLYGDVVINSDELTLPHPQLPYRRFALMPLCEIAPQLVHPSLHTTISELLAQCPDRLEVTLVNE
jgi:2-amino-4-hydroxy-6-hydroxymethyldihydropteridine diphosphokinase